MASSVLETRLTVGTVVLRPAQDTGWLWAQSPSCGRECRDASLPFHLPLPNLPGPALEAAGLLLTSWEGTSRGAELTCPVSHGRVGSGLRLPVVAVSLSQLSSSLGLSSWRDGEGPSKNRKLSSQF